MLGLPRDWFVQVTAVFLLRYVLPADYLDKKKSDNEVEAFIVIFTIVKWDVHVSFNDYYVVVKYL